MNFEKHKRHIDQLYEEKIQKQYELFAKLDTLIKAEWDSNTLKIRIEKLAKERDRLEEEINDLEEQVSEYIEGDKAHGK